MAVLLSNFFTRSFKGFMIESLISSRTRINLLVKFFINAKNVSYLRGLASEFEESTNSIRVELNRFENAGLLVSEKVSNKKFYRANTTHPLYSEINKIVLKHTGVDALVNKLIKHIGKLESVYLVGKLAKGLNDEVLELVIFGNINEEKLQGLVPKFERALSRKIFYQVFENLEDCETLPEGVLLWKKDS